MDKKIIVAALDIGATNSCFAFSLISDFKTDPRKVFSLPTLARYGRTPSVILLSPQKTFDSIGHTALTKYTELKENGRHTEWYLFKRFKIKLHEPMVTPETEIEDCCGKKMRLTTVFSVFIQYYKEQLMNVLKNVQVGEDEILWVLNVPAVWTDSAHQVLRKSAYEAGIKEQNLTILPDSVAASVYFTTPPAIDCAIASGTKFMVVDVGGGTMDITVFKVQSVFVVTETYNVSLALDEEDLYDGFFRMIEEIIGNGALENFKKDEFTDYMELKRAVELVLGKDFSEFGKSTLKIPVVLLGIYEKNMGITVQQSIDNSPYKDRITWRDDRMRLGSGLLKSCFCEYIDNMIGHIKEASKHPMVAETELVLLTGLVSESKFLIEEIKEKAKPLKVIVPDDASFVNVIGAVMYGHMPRKLCVNIEASQADGIQRCQTLPRSNFTKKREERKQNKDREPTQRMTASELELDMKGHNDIVSAMEDFLDKYSKDEARYEEHVNRFREQLCKTVESFNIQIKILNAQTEEMLTEKDGRDKRILDVKYDVESLKNAMKTQKKAFEEHIYKLKQERDDFKQWTEEARKKYDSLQNEFVSVKKDNDSKEKLLKYQQHELEQQMKQLQYTSSTLQTEMYVREEEKQKILRDCHSLREQLEVVKRSYENQLQELAIEIDDIRQKLHESERTNSEMEMRYKKSDSLVVEKLEIIRKLGSLVNQHASEELSLNQQLANLADKNANLEKTLSSTMSGSLREKNLLKEIDTLKESLTAERMKHEETKRMLAQKHEDQRERDTAKEREESADVAELSDPNRRAKLCERYSVLFEDEWSNTFDIITDRKNNLRKRDAIHMLLYLLKECFEYCEMIGQSQMEDLKKTLLDPTHHFSTTPAFDRQAGQKMHQVAEGGVTYDKALLDLRRQMTLKSDVMEQIKQACLNNVKASMVKDEKGFDRKHIETCTLYILQCAELCWCMIVLDPPLHMKFSFKEHEKFDHAVYTAYTTSGDTVDYLVWPPLYDGEDGKLLVKGIAEAYKS